MAQDEVLDFFLRRVVDEVVGDLDEDVVAPTFGAILVEAVVLQELLEQDVYDFDCTLLVLLPKRLH